MNAQKITVWERFEQLGQAVLSLFGVGVHHVEDAAERAQTAEMALDDAADAAKIDAQKTLDVINSALTEHGKIEMQLEQQREVVAHWDELAREAGTAALSLPEGSPERTKKETLAKEALRNKDIAEMELQPLQEAYDASKPLAEQALQQAEQVGFTREEALSQTKILKVQNATAQGQLALAKAARGGGLERTKALLDEARAKVNETVAQARAEKQISSVLPKDASAVEAEIGISGRQQRIDDKFGKMMSELKGTPTAA